jgi:hypothetical protein
LQKFSNLHRDSKHSHSLATIMTVGCMVIVDRVAGAMHGCRPAALQQPAQRQQGMANSLHK